MTLRVLYLTAANLIQPQVGMDMVSNEHWRELVHTPGLQLQAISVAPGIPGHPKAGRHLVHGHEVEVFVGDQARPMPKLARLWDKLQMVCTRAVPVMAYSFRSRDAARRIQDILHTGQHEVVVIDHFYTLANLPLHALSDSPARWIYVSHDAMSPHILEMAASKSSALARAYFRMEAWRMHLGEQKLFRLAHRIVHLSEFERLEAAPRDARHLALLPLLQAPTAGGLSADDLRAGDAARAAAHRGAVFIGSPKHPPNAHALAWLLRDLAPAMLRLAPGLQLHLVGKGTEALADQAPPNVRCWGFVSDHVLQQLLAGCLCALSPVVIGRGIKVKVLDAVAAGCPVLATEESLRGLEPLQLQAGMALDKPDELALCLREWSQNPDIPHRQRETIQAAWRRFCDMRQGALGRLVRDSGI
jgi:glycosyltransferase involved in cell wall biosynthesis